MMETQTNVNMRDVAQFLSAKQAEESDQEIVAEYAKLEELYNKKLWHQVTLAVQGLVKHPSLQSGDNLIQLYNNFVVEFENKINPSSLVEVVACVIQQHEPEEGLKLLEKTEMKVKHSAVATALCKVLSGQIRLHKLRDKEGTKKLLEEIEKILEDIDGITPVHGRFYLLASDLYRIQGKHAEYYRAALRYLGCINLSDLSEMEQQQYAFFLGLAALLGEGVYNFGELLAHPVLESLRNSDKKWVVDLLYAFNAGNLPEFENLRPAWEVQADLKAHELALRQKIALLSLMEMTFKRPATDRQLTFQEIAKETRLSLSEVELLVMKALAQGLVKGSIDQVAGKVHMTWVQPRVLDRIQISTMMQKLDLWCHDVNSMEVLLENKANDILTL